MATLLGLDVDFLRDDVHNVYTRLGIFDVIICSGLMYHIPDPTNVLARLSDVCADTILIESEFLLDPALTLWPGSSRGPYRDDPTNWWIYGPECLEGMVTAAGFQTHNSGLLLRTTRGKDRRRNPREGEEAS